jgi:hypothetical protein
MIDLERYLFTTKHIVLISLLRDKLAGSSLSKSGICRLTGKVMLAN